MYYISYIYIYIYIYICVCVCVCVCEYGYGYVHLFTFPPSLFQHSPAYVSLFLFLSLSLFSVLISQSSLHLFSIPFPPSSFFFLPSIYLLMILLQYLKQSRDILINLNADLLIKRLPLCPYI